MKKYLLLLGGVIHILFSSCEEENRAPKQNLKFEKNRMTCTAEDSQKGDKLSGVAIIPNLWRHTPGIKGITKDESHKMANY